MTPINAAVKALQSLYDAEPGAIARLLQCNSVILSPEFDPGPGVPWIKDHRGQSFDTLDLINALLYAATGNRVAVNAPPWSITFSVHGRPTVVVDDFDAEQGWEGIDDALDYCSRQPDPDTAVRLIVDANLRVNEYGWVVEFLRQCPRPGTWQAPDQPALRMAMNYLADLDPAWELPGYIDIAYKGVDFAFGDVNGPIGFDYALPDHQEGAPRLQGEATLSPTASCARMADFVREQVKAVCAAHGIVEEPEPPAPASNRFWAVPVLVYVPIEEGDGEAAEARAVEQLRADSGLRVYIAEDYQTTEAAETPDDDLSAMIGAACESN